MTMADPDIAEVMPHGTKRVLAMAAKALREAAPKQHSKRSAVFRGIAVAAETLLEGKPYHG